LLLEPVIFAREHHVLQKESGAFCQEPKGFHAVEQQLGQLHPESTQEIKWSIVDRGKPIGISDFSSKLLEAMPQPTRT
jgi:hypothetical protein